MTTEPNKKYYELNDSLCLMIKNRRMELNLTQDEVANKAGISRRSYARIESCNMTRIKADILETLSGILNFNLPDDSSNYNLRCTFSLSPELKYGLSYLQMRYRFDSLSETIQYCVEQVVTENFKSNVSQDIKNDIREALSNSYNAELDKLKKESDINQLILTYLSQTGAIDLPKIKKDINNLMNKVNHADRY